MTRGRLVLRYAPLLLVAFWPLLPIPATSDAANYWSLDLADPYRNGWAAAESFVYAPAFGQVIFPFTLLPFEVFYRLLLAVNLACLWWLTGPWSVLALSLPPVYSELHTGQIHLPLAVATVAMLRYPGAWAFLVLTKVTPGVTMLWWVGRGEWRRAGGSSDSQHRRPIRRDLAFGMGRMDRPARRVLHSPRFQLRREPVAGRVEAAYRRGADGPCGLARPAGRPASHRVLCPAGNLVWDALNVGGYAETRRRNR